LAIPIHAAAVSSGSFYEKAVVDFEPASNSQLFVKDSFVRRNAPGGVFIKPAVGATASVAIDTVRMGRN
jgi:hypothetical protein